MNAGEAGEGTEFRGANKPTNELYNPDIRSQHTVKPNGIFTVLRVGEVLEISTRYFVRIVLYAIQRLPLRQPLLSKMATSKHVLFQRVAN